MNYRDIRDVIASWQKKNNFILTLEDGLKWASNTIRILERWENISCKRNLISKYEIFSGNIKEEVVRISKLIGVDIENNIADKIEEIMQVEKFQERLESLSNDQIEIDNNLSWDKKNLIHLDHFQDGGVLVNIKMN